MLYYSKFLVFLVQVRDDLSMENNMVSTVPLKLENTQFGYANKNLLLEKGIKMT